MFEVGKKYKAIEGKCVYTCVGTHSTFGWMEQEGQKDYPPITYTWGPHWKEYIEPPSEDWRAVYRSPDGLKLSRAMFDSEKEVRSVWGEDDRFVKAVRVDGGDT